MRKKIREITLDFTGVKTLWELHERIRWRSTCSAERTAERFSAASWEENKAICKT